MRLHLRRFANGDSGSWTVEEGRSSVLRGTWTKSDDGEVEFPQSSIADKVDLEANIAWRHRHLEFFKTLVFCPSNWSGIRWEENGEGEQDWVGITSNEIGLYLSSDCPANLAKRNELHFSAGYKIGDDLAKAQTDVEFGMYWLADQWHIYTNAPYPDPEEDWEDAPDQVDLAAYARAVDDDLMDKMRAIQNAFEAYKTTRSEALRLREMAHDMRKRGKLGRGSFSAIENLTDLAISEAIFVEIPGWMDD